MSNILEIKSNVNYFSRNTKKAVQTVTVPDQGMMFTEEAQALRWFLLPMEAKIIMTKLIKSRGPVCSNRLDIKRFPDTDEVANVGTLDGDEPLTTKFVLNPDRKVTKGSWLLTSKKQQEGKLEISQYLISQSSV